MNQSNEFTIDTVINKLRQLKISYIQNDVGRNPAELPNHFAEFLGYATLLYDHYAEYIKKYEIREAKVIKEENEQRVTANAERTEANRALSKEELKTHKQDMVTITEVEQRIDARIGELKAEKKRLEQSVKGATLHINGCQSLMKNWSDESKGIR